ncbi:MULTISPECIES: ribonuclease Z [Providencia]|uniref:Ribonuclease BN n=1 Tax=Providencia rettgeri TaxID=587 RepID=A0AAE2XEX1_PRORE|nr:MULTISPECIES: ribonuclease Z [Providencia]HCI95350.1 ribonuclease Z [Providencia sp.]EJD6043891.1 ribonuclease Z [Providencia rettgeri]EJD6081199.1 ribonuclease Z [Providencia rettgeri]EJD6367395.1 ribonuclease Z [Providencia rettgeri]EJD6371624.1 ribonuclease Z [Providencia rettgeri]
MELTFLGTSAGVPTKERNVTSMILNLVGIRKSYWLFDCGEGTQHRILNSPFKTPKIDKIFITHLHGDHIFGLPGLLCSRSMGGATEPLTLYGPKGLKQYVETVLSVSESYMTYPLNIIEIQAGQLFDDGELIVTAYPLDHRVECYGYRIEEHAKSGALDAERLAQDNIPRGPWMQDLKAGKTITLEDGRTVNGAEYLGEPISGKVIAIFGDTQPTDQGLALAKNADVMVHETTLEAAFAEKANERGHSTTEQAARLARAAGVKRFIATHLSGRYMTHDIPRLLAECQAIFPATIMAEDYLTVKI